MQERGRTTEGSTKGDTDEIMNPWHQKTLFDAVDDGIYRLDATGRFVAVSDSIVDKTGYSRDELLGEHVSVIIDDRDVERLEREIRTRLETGVDDDTTFDLVIEAINGVESPASYGLAY